MNLLFAITLLLPFVGALLIVLLSAVRVSGSGRAVALLSAGLTLAGVAALALARDGADVSLAVAWVPAVGVRLSFAMDAFSQPLLVLTALVGVAAFLMSPVSLPRAREFHFLMLVTLGAGLCAFAARNLLLFFFCCEITTIPKYLLTAIWGRLPGEPLRLTARDAALQVTLFIAAGAMLVMLALSVLFVVGGHDLDLAALARAAVEHPLSHHAQVILYGAMLLGFGIWSSLWPFHIWSPVTYAAAPPPAAMLFAGVLKNFGPYGLLLVGLHVLPDGARAWSGPLAVMATVNILYGGWAAMRQRDWCYLIAYGSVSHVGYLFLALAAGGTFGLQATILYMFAHGVVAALLFALAGLLEQGAGTRRLPALGGLAHALPFVSAWMTVAVVAASGLPGSANFVAEVSVFVAAWQHGGGLLRVGAVAAVWGIVMTAVYFFRALRETFHGPPRARPEGSVPPTGAQRAGILALAAACVIVGLWPRLVTDPLRRVPVAPRPVAMSGGERP